MRVLCLHGMGTNSGIFEAQSQMFRSLLPQNFEYEFFNAENEYPAAEGCGEIFPGPYYCFYPVPTINNVENAHEYVQDIMDEEGPFDAVMGFSQGAALAASILLRHQKERPLEPAPFRFAVFICGSLPYWINTEQGVDVAGLFLRPSSTGFGPPEGITYEPSKDDGSAETKEMAGSSTKKLGKSEVEIADLERRFSSAMLDEERWNRLRTVASQLSASEDSESESDEDQTFSPGESSTGSHSPFSPFDDSEDGSGSDFEKKRGILAVGSSGDHIVRRLHPSLDKLRIGIPTAHIYGSKDPYFRQSLGLAKLCEPRWASTYEHPEGHIVPREKGVNLKIAAAIERTVRMVDVFLR